MPEFNDWDIVAANNNSTPPDGWPENTMNYSEVNNSAREGMAVQARYFKDINGSLNGGGSVNAYSITLNAAYTGYFDGMYFAMSIPADNTAASTLNVNSIGVQSIVNRDGTALTSGTLQSGGVYEFRYDGTNFQLMGSVSTTGTVSLGTLNLNTDVTVDLTDALATLVVGPGAAAHQEHDSNTIQAKSNATTAADLFLNHLGANVHLGPVSGTGQVIGYRDAAAVFRSLTAALGGLEANNTLTGAGFERVMTAPADFVDISGKADKSITITGSGNDGLGGGGDLSANRSLRIDFGSLLQRDIDDVSNTDGIIVEVGGSVRVMEYEDMGIPIQSRSTTQTFTKSDSNTFQVLTGSTNRIWTINTSVTYHPGTVIMLHAQDTGAIIISPSGSAGLTSIIANDSQVDRTVPPGGTAVMVHVSGGEWALSGDYS